MNTMSKTEAKKKADEIAQLDNGGPLPGEAPTLHPLPTGEDLDALFEDAPVEMDTNRFVKIEHVGATFTGQFIRKIDHKGQDKDRVKYPGFLFAEYPSGALKVLPPNWSIGEFIAKHEEEDGTFFVNHIVRLELADIVTKPDDTTVKLYKFRWVPRPYGFAPVYDEHFPMHGELIACMDAERSPSPFIPTT